MPSLEYRGRRRDGTHAWRVIEYVQGRKMTRTFHTPTDSKRSAERKSRKILVEMAEEIEARGKRAGSVAELVDAWMAIHRRDKSPSTLASYQRHSSHLVARLGTEQVVALEGKHLDAWYNDLLDDGWSPANVHHLHRVVRAVLNFGAKKRRQHSPALDEVTLPKLDRTEIQLPTPAAVDALVSSTTGEWGRCVRLLREVGMRRGEVVGLLWDDVHGETMVVRHSVLDVKGGGVHVKAPKGGRAREVWLSDAAQAVLDEQWRAKRPGESPWIFPGWVRDPSGRTPRSPGSVSTMWRKHCEAVGVSMRLHDLRHAWATENLAAGVPLHVVSAQLGHAQVSTTLNIYGHANDEGRAALARAMNRPRTVELPAP